MFDGVIDISHHNGPNVDFRAVAGSGITGVIHKATQGTSFVDPNYSSNRARAKDAGLLFGSYHFGVDADGAAQADFYLKTVGPMSGELLALDFEGNNSGPSMTIQQAKDFVSAIHGRVGRWPVLYSGYFLKQLLGGKSDPILCSCPLWIAQYGPAAVLPSGWSEWKLWQWTDGATGVAPQPVDGVGHCDRDRFSGAAPDLAAFWNSVSAPAVASG